MWKLRSILCMLAHCHGYIAPGIINPAKKGITMRSLPSWGVHSGVARAIELVGHHCACAEALTTPTN